MTTNFILALACSWRNHRHICASLIHSRHALTTWDKLADLRCTYEDWHSPLQFVLCAFFILHFVTWATGPALNVTTYVFRKYRVLLKSRSKYCVAHGWLWGVSHRIHFSIDFPPSTLVLLEHFATSKTSDTLTNVDIHVWLILWTTWFSHLWLINVVVPDCSELS